MHEDTEVIPMCSECKSPQSWEYIEKQPFKQPVCKFCGGSPVVFVFIPPGANRDKIIHDRRAQMDRERGIGTGHEWQGESKDGS